MENGYKDDPSQFGFEHVISSNQEENVKKVDKAQQASLIFEKSKMTQTRNQVDQEVQVSVEEFYEEEYQYGEEIVEFLNKVLPIMEKELSENLKTKAFRGYDVEWGDDNESVTLEHVFQRRIEQKSLKNEKLRDFEYEVNCCSDCSWNCNGTTIAVGYGETNHTSWCSHRSVVCIWNVLKRIQRSKEDQSYSKPDIEIEHQCCSTCVAFHPTAPNILAEGLFNGEIRIYDLDQEEEYLVAHSGIDDYFHREPVNKICWVSDFHSKYDSSKKSKLNSQTPSSHFLVSIGGDGRILFWTITNKLKHPRHGMCLVPTRLYHGHGSTINDYSILGGTAMGFSSDYNSFVVGSEGGGLVKGIPTFKNVSRIGKADHKENYIEDGEFSWHPYAYDMMENASNQYEVKRIIEKYARLNKIQIIKLEHVFESRPDPIMLFPSVTQFAFTPHDGPIYSICFSPFQRNIFATCSTDSFIRIYNTIESKPLLNLEVFSNYVLDLKWSTTRPLVIAAVDSIGQLLIYDFLKNMKGPICIIKANDIGTPLNSVDFDNRDGSYVATTDANGKIQIWKLNSGLCSLQNGELSILEKFGKFEV